MNRNTMYYYLKEKGLYSIRRWSDDRNRYHTEFRPNRELDQKNITIKFDWGYVRNVKYIWLYASEIVLEGAISDLKINVNYRDIEKFEVDIEYEDE